MSEIRSRQVPLRTAADGTVTVPVRLVGLIHGLGLQLGTLDTPDLTVTDGLTGAPVLAVTGVAADTRWQPRVVVQDDVGANISGTHELPAITGRLDCAVAGGGDTKEGTLVVLYEE